jgi:hypothetical protein
MIDKIFFTILCITNIFIAFHYDVPFTLIITVSFLVATAAMNCCNKDWFLPVIVGSIFSYSIGTNDLIYMWLVPILFIFSFVGSISDVIKEEKDYIWKMNNGPSTLNRMRFIKRNGIIHTYKWIGGANGFYVDEEKNKFDRYLNEIKNDLS